MDRKEQMRVYYQKNREAILKKQKEYQAKHKEERHQYKEEYDKKNKDKRKQYDQEYSKTPQGKKCNKIKSWKAQDIIFFNWDILYEIYTDCKYCDYCKCEFNDSFNNQKCLDHDHSITEYDNVRGVLCQPCNLKDVLK